MGEHDQKVLHDEDAHQSIHDDGRTFRQGGLVYNSGYPVAVPEPGVKQVFIYRGEKLIPDTVYIHSDAFSVTKWESFYSDMFALQSPRFYYDASFAPVVDDSWRVVGHVGWADGFDICVPGDTVQKGSKFWSILRQRRLGEERQQLLDDADRLDRGRLPNFPFHTTPTSSPPVRKLDNCVPPAPTTKWKPTIWEEARSGPLKEKTIEEAYLNDLNYFVKGGGKALVGTYTYMEIERVNHLEHSWFSPYLDAKIPGSSRYRFQVLVSPDGYLQAVLGIEKVRPKTLWDKKISDILDGIDIAMTVLMIIDIPVVLFRLGALVAEKAAIRAVEVVIDREAKAALDLTMREMQTIPKEELAKAWGAGPRPRPLTDSQLERAIELLRNGQDVHVESLEQMRQIQGELGQLGVRSESSSSIIPQRPAVNKAGVSEMEGSYVDGPGTYRSDPPHKLDKVVPDGPKKMPYSSHSEYPHINITLRNGKTLAVIVTGSKSF
jgi:hypothetical protein